MPEGPELYKGASFLNSQPHFSQHIFKRVRPLKETSHKHTLIPTVTDVKLLEGVLVTRERVIVISVVSITLNLGIVVMSSLSVEAGDEKLFIYN